MSEFRGVVGAVHKKDWKNGIFLYHFELEGSPIVHNCGSADPQIKEGEAIKFTESNRKVNTSTIERISAAEAETSVPEPQAPDQIVSCGTPSKDDIGERIRRQQARRDAISLVTMAMQTDLLPYPKSGKARDKWDRMLDLVDETTNDLLQQEEERWTKQSA